MATAAAYHEIEALPQAHIDVLNKLDVPPISTSPLLQWLDSKERVEGIHHKELNLSAYEDYLDTTSSKSLGLEATKLLTSLIEMQTLVTEETVAHIKWKTIAETLINFIEASSFVSVDTIFKEKNRSNVNVVKALCNKVTILHKDLEATKKVNEYLQEKLTGLAENELNLSRALVISNSINHALQNQITTMSNTERDIRTALQKGSNVKMNKRLAVLNDSISSLNDHVELLRDVVAQKEAEIKALESENHGMHLLLSDQFELHKTVRGVVSAVQKNAHADGVLAYGHANLSAQQIAKHQSKAGKEHLLLSEEACISAMCPIYSEISYTPVEGDEIDMQLAKFLNARKNLIFFLPISTGIYIYGHRIVKLDLNDEYSSGLSVNTGGLLYSLTNFVQEFEKDEFEFLDAVRTMSDKQAFENLLQGYHLISKLQQEEGKAPTIGASVAKSITNSYPTTAQTFSLEEDETISDLDEGDEDVKIIEDETQLFGDRALNIPVRSTQLYKGYPLKFDMNLADRVVHQVSISTSEVQEEPDKKKKKKKSSRYSVFADKQEPIVPLPAFDVKPFSKLGALSAEAQALELEAADEEGVQTKPASSTYRPLIFASTTKFPISARPSVISKNQMPFNAMKKSEIF